MPARVCLGCGAITGRPSSSGRCPECQRDYEQARPSRTTYDDPRWQRAARAAIARWRRLHGDWCPGWGREGHPATDLTGDHTTALARGGARWDPSNIGVLCRSCNGRKGASSTPATRH